MTPGRSLAVSFVYCTWTLALLAPLASAASVFRVRPLSSSSSKSQHFERRKEFTLELTFSDEGEAIELPPYQLQLYPTTQDLDDTSELFLETALEDYLRSRFEMWYPDVDDEEEEEDAENGETSESTTPVFTMLTVDVWDMTSFQWDGSRRLHQPPKPKRQGQQEQPISQERSLQRYGTTLDVKTTLRFKEGNFPTSEQLEHDMETALFDNFNIFLSEYLFVYATPELLAVDTGNYISGFTNSPTSRPTPSPTVNSGNDGSGPVFSEANQQPVNVRDKENRWNALYPAIFCGVAMFLLTALWLAHRRTRISDLDVDSESDGGSSSCTPSDMEHISVDYDGRAEARELELEQERYNYEQQQLQMERAQQLQEQQYRSRPMAGPLQSVQIRDGQTTVHVPPIMMDGRSGSRRYEPSTILVRTASNLDGSFYHNDDDHEEDVGGSNHQKGSFNIYGTNNDKGMQQRGQQQGYPPQQAQRRQPSYPQQHSQSRQRSTPPTSNPASYSRIRSQQTATTNGSRSTWSGSVGEGSSVVSEETRDHSTYTDPNDGYELTLPSMHGGTEFGMCGVINRGLL